MSISPGRGSSRMTLAAAGIGAVSGLVEGLQLNLARGMPTVLAPYKVSADILWLAPALNALCFSVAGALLVLLAVGRAARHAERIVASGLVGAAIAINLYTLKLIHPGAALFLALAIGVALWRLPAGTVQGLLRRAGQVALLTPLLVLAVFGAVRMQRTLGERRATATLSPARADAPNVLVLLLDTVRRDRFDAARGSARTPRLHAFSSRATWFANAWSTTSWSLPSQASVLTGLHPHQHGADWPALELKPELKTLPERFAAAGYVTGGFSGNAAWIVPEHLGRGFHRFRVYSLEDLARRTLIGRALDRPLIAMGWHAAGRGRPAASVSRELLDFLDARGSRPFFAYLCYMDVNRAFNRRRLGHPAWRSGPDVSSMVAAYDGALTDLDAELGSLLDRLRARGLLAKTIVVILSDHGESFPGGVPGDHEPAGHGTSLFPEQVRVPMWIAPVGSVSGDTVTADVSIRDLAATVARLAGIPSTGLGGRPLLGPAAPPDRDVLATLRYAGREENALVSERWLLIEHAPGAPAPLSLFDLLQDPLAQVDRPADSVRAARLRARLRRALEE